MNALCFMKWIADTYGACFIQGTPQGIIRLKCNWTDGIIVVQYMELGSPLCPGK